MIPVKFIGTDLQDRDKYLSIINKDRSLTYKDDQFYVSEETVSELKKELNNKFTIIRPEIDADDIGSELKLSLYPYQKDVVKFCLEHQYGILVLPCGAGKTPIGIDIYVDARKKGIISSDGKGLVIVKSSLKVQWSKEVEKFSNLKASVLDTYKSVKPSIQARIRKLQKEQEPFMKDVIRYASDINEYEAKIKELQDTVDKEFAAMFDDQYDLFIANYETLRDPMVRRQLHKLKLEYMYVDEAHSIKSDTAAKSKAVYEFADVKMRFGATATPIQKNPLDAYGISKFVSPGTFKSKTAFSSRYLTYSGFGRVSGSKNEKELNQKLSEFMIIKQKEEVAKQLPNLVVIQRFCKLEPKQLETTDKLLAEIKEYKEQEKNLIAKFGGTVSESNEELLKIQANILARQTFASELATSEELLKDSDSDLARKYYTGSKSNKIELFLDLSEEILESGEKIAVFSKYRRLQDVLTKEINKRFPDAKIAYVNGGLSSEQRYNEIYNKFQAKDEYKFLLMSSSANEGVNLSACKYLIEMEPADSYLEQTQRRGRIERADSIHDTVYVYQLIAEKSFDEISLKIIDKKERYDAQIIKGEL